MSAVPLARQVVAAGLLVSGLFALGYAAWVVTDEHAYQTAERERFEGERLRDSGGGEQAQAPVEGRSLGEIEIRRLGLIAMVVHGESAAILRRAVGHLPDTALPGERGNVVLAGHRDTFFRPLKDVRAGDAIRLRTRTADFDYVVESMSVVSPSDLHVLEPTGDHTLTLITCFPFVYLGAAPDRFVVRARQVAGPG
jgi:sortase A